MGSFRRKFDGKISEGQWSQLLWVICCIVVSLILFLVLSKIIYTDDVFCWQDIIALYLDPGVFNGAGNHDIFRLIVTLFGAFLFAAVLISIVSNILNNISESFKKGSQRRYGFNHHILILGGSNLLFEILEGIAEDKNHCYQNRQIVVMSTRQTEGLRDDTAAFLNDRRLLKRITFYYDKRDSVKNLKEAHADKADYIFVIGEEMEPCHDLINMNCSNLLHDINKSKDTICYVIMDSHNTMQVIYPELRGLRDSDGKLCYDNQIKGAEYNEIFLNINEVKAEHILSNTILGYSNLYQKTNVEPVINIVIFGMTAFGRAIAKTLSFLFHFNEELGKKKITRITIIDSEMKSKKDDFTSRHKLLMNHCSFCYIDESGTVQEAINKDNSDILWTFIDAAPSSDLVIRFFNKKIYNNNNSDNIFCFVCFDDISKNISTVLNLRSHFDRLKVFADYGNFENELNSRLCGIPTDSGFSTLFSYAFDKRYEIVHKYYSDYQDKNPNDYKWEELYQGDKQLAAYKSIIADWSQRAGEGIFNIMTCASYAGYLMGIDNSSNEKHYDSRKHYLDQLIEYEKFEYMGEKLTFSLDLIYEKLVRQYIFSLENFHDECDIGSFIIHTLFAAYQYIESEAFENVLYALKKYVNGHRLSEDTILALLHCCNPILEKDDNGISIGTIVSIPDNIINLSKEIIKIQSDRERSEQYSILAWSAISDRDEEMKGSFIKAKEIKNVLVPYWYFNKIGKEKAETLYSETKYEEILDYLISCQIPEINLFNFTTDFISQTESYVRNWTSLDNEYLYYRIAIAKGLNSSFQGMWLQKAEKSARDNNNAEIQLKSLLRLEYYFNSRNKEQSTVYSGLIDKLIKENYDYFHKNRNIVIIDEPQDEIEKYIKYRTENLLATCKEIQKVGPDDYDVYIPSGEFTDNVNIFEEDYDNSLSDDTCYVSYEERIEINQNINKHICEKIEFWENEFPNIDHPYQKALDELASMY